MTEDPFGKARAELLAQQLQNAQKIEALGRLTNAVVHDLNNILAVIVGNIELLLQDTRSRAVRSELVEIRQGADLGADLVRQLLSFSRSPSSAAEIIDVGATLTQFHRILTRLVGRQIQVEIDTGAHPTFICLGPGLLEQVIMNLAQPSQFDGIRTANSFRFSTGDR